tara:strand:+ start:598 stop:1137 length:540 start_codon:yes stop_codon:yes gene_type:complete
MNELILSKLDVATASVNVMHGKMFAFANLVDPIEPALGAVAKTDAEADTGFTLANNTVTTCASTSDAAQDFTLPAATAGSYVIYRQSALADAANAMDWICAGTDTFEANQVCSTGELVAQHDVSAATDVKLIITPAATNPGWGQIGSQIHFFCRQDGKWLVKVQGMKLGTGAVTSLSFA